MISVRNGGKSFDNRLIFKNLNFEILPGERFTVIGQSGSGKSVLMKLLTGLLPPTEGTFIIDKTDVTNYSEEEWNHIRFKFGVVFQGSALFDSLNILQNTGIRLFEEKKLTPVHIKERVIESLESVGLGSDVLYKLPSDLSGGMKKRVAVARALIHKPEYLFYDEPLAGLDPISSELIDELILQVAEERPSITSIIISHDMYSVKKLAHRILLIHQTEQHFLGTPAEFFSSKDPVICQFLSRKI